MVSTRTREQQQADFNEYELHQRKSGKRFISLLILGIVMGILASLLSFVFRGNSPEVATETVETVNAVSNNANNATQEAVSQAGETANDLTSKAGDTVAKIGETTQGVAGNLGNATQEAVSQAGETANDLTSKAGDTVAKIGETTQGVAGNLGNATQEVVSQAGETANDLTSKAGDTVTSLVSGTSIGKIQESLASGTWDINKPIQLNVDKPIKFSYGSAVLTPDGAKTVQQVAKELQQLDTEKVTVKVVGHTSNTGNPQVNLSLSQQRADAVAQRLRDWGIKHQIITEGQGSNQPLDGISKDNASQQRTEINLVRIK